MDSHLCRQSSTRWIPTADQIRILRDLYYNNGVRSPTAEQIQRISARLRQYGKIEGKNVFYWFQNHKARERQKKKLTMDHNLSNSSTITNNDHSYNDKLNTTTIGHYHGFGTSTGFYDVGQMGGNGFGGSPVFMERSISDGQLMDSNIGYVGIEPAMPWVYHYIKEEEPPLMPAAREIETLPLFPTHSQEEDGEDQQQQQQQDEEDEEDKFGVTLHHSFSSDSPEYCTQPNGYLELTLNSYYYANQGSM